jgi:hypothetical protein
MIFSRSERLQPVQVKIVALVSSMTVRPRYELRHVRHRISTSQ